MYVNLCWRTKDTEKGKIYVSKRMTIKDAMLKFKEIENTATRAYLRYFDGWHNRIHKILIDNQELDKDS